MRRIMRLVTTGLAVFWLMLVATLGWWMSQRVVSAHLDRMADSAGYEAKTTARIVDRLFTEMVSVTNMVARQNLVIQLATRYRTDPPGFDELTRQQRAARFTSDPLVRRVGDFMNELAYDLGYARIYLNNMSDDTVTSSNWAEPDSIVGIIYSGRSYLQDALEHGNGHMFGIARLLKTQSYFVSSRIDDADDAPLGSVTVKFDAPDMAHYLTGQHVALIVNRQGRVTTTSSEPFMLRNVAALLPEGTVELPDGDEKPGEPMDIRPMPASASAGQWMIEGRPYLVRHHQLSNTQYQLLTLAELDHLEPMRRQHFWTAAVVGVLGLALILLSCHAVGHVLLRRQDERYAANHDVLTGLPNRRAVMAELDLLFAQARRKQLWVLVAFIDLDDFKSINDTYGHEVGDQFLIEVARRMSAGLRESDMLGRLGGDEFIVIGLADAPGADNPDEAAHAMRSRLAPLLIGTYNFGAHRFDYSGASFGIACVNPSASSPQAGLKDADQLMYADKQIRRARGAP